jgi:uncharacterized protein (TIGR00369 family)
VTTTSPARERRVAWSDPLATARAGREMAGLDFLRAMKAGTLPPPPFLVLLDVVMGEIERGRVTVSLSPAEYHYNPYGMVHGGVVAAMLDTVMSCAILSQQPAGRGNTTIDLTVNFLRAVTMETGPVTAEGTVIHLGRTTGLAQGRLIDETGRLCAIATTTCLLVDLAVSR